MRCPLFTARYPELIARLQREDIFPLIETEDLVKFRINYLRAEAWKKSCLVEYYTVAFKYEHDGSYALDIWRAGTGQHHIATSDAHLWNLGDYLSRLRSCAGRIPFSTLTMS
jgi:hypothetical protein